MIYAFMIPICLGNIPYLGICYFGFRLPSGIFTQVYAAGVMTLTTGSIIRGVLDIYGTTNSKLALYLYAGSVLCAAGTAAFVSVNRKTDDQKSRTPDKPDPAAA